MNFAGRIVDAWGDALLEGLHQAITPKLNSSGKPQAEEDIEKVLEGCLPCRGYAPYAEVRL